MGKSVKGFKASSNDHRGNVELLDYKSDDDFIVRLKLKQTDEELYLIKGSQDKLPQEISHLTETEHNVQVMNKNDQFAMPIVELEV